MVRKRAWSRKGKVKEMGKLFVYQKRRMAKYDNFQVGTWGTLVYFTFLITCIKNRKRERKKQAGAELCQAQIRFGLVSIGMA